MEILFENSHVRNKELAKELYRYTMYKRPIMVFIHIAFLLSFACNIALIWDQSSNWAVLIVLWTNANLLYILHKDTFGVRGKDEFLSFLRGKGIKVK